MNLRISIVSIWLFSSQMPSPQSMQMTFKLNSEKKSNDEGICFQQTKRWSQKRLVPCSAYPTFSSLFFHITRIILEEVFCQVSFDHLSKNPCGTEKHKHKKNWIRSKEERQRHNLLNQVLPLTLTPLIPPVLQIWYQTTLKFNYSNWKTNNFKWKMFKSILITKQIEIKVK